MILSNFTLPELDETNFRKLLVINRPNKAAFKNALYIIHNRHKIKGILNANPSTFGVILLALLKLFFLRNSPIFIFDLILKNPHGATERMIAKLKGVFLRRFDYILAIHKDTSGYEKQYNLKPQQFIYIPFKANNFDTANEASIVDGNYIVALGASQRDYPTFLDAVKAVDLEAVIVCSDKGALDNNADVGDSKNYPANTKRITTHVPTEEWYRWIAESKFVVVPIKDTAIQPAGISVYLEAMRLRKATIVSDGASANCILEHEKNALIVPAGDASALEAAIVRLASNTELRQTIAENGYHYAQKLGNDARLRLDIAKTIKAICCH